MLHIYVYICLYNYTQGLFSKSTLSCFLILRIWCTYVCLLSSFQGNCWLEWVLWRPLHECCFLLVEVSVAELLKPLKTQELQNVCPLFLPLSDAFNDVTTTSCFSFILLRKTTKLWHYNLQLSLCFIALKLSNKSHPAWQASFLNYFW